MTSPANPERALILCIDDDPVALRVRNLLLTGAGYDVLTAPSGEAGLDLLKENPVNLVIADHFLSEKTGTEIAREMKELKADVPILIVSAAAEKLSGIELVDGFIAKGESPDVLLETIRRVLRN